MGDSIQADIDESGELDRGGIAFLLRTIAQQLALIPTDVLEQYIQEGTREIGWAETLGPIFGPTSYIRSRADGTLEDARRQLYIAVALLTARKAIDQREEYVRGLVR